MDFTFSVGDSEKHRVDFHFNQFWGNLRIKIDNETVVKDFRTYEVSDSKKYEFPVGSRERHDVVVEITRKSFLGSARKQACKVYVDGRLQEQH